MITDDANSAIYFYIYDNQVNLRLYDSLGGQKSVTSSTIYVDNWYHVVGTFGGADLKLYVGGILVDTTTGVPSINTNTNEVWVGRNERWSGELFEGLVDEVRMYNRDLNAADCNYLYKNPSGTIVNLASALLMVTDLDGVIHPITEDIEDVVVNRTLSYASNTFSCEVANHDGIYDFIEFGCEIDIYLGMGGYNTKRLSGIITDATYTLDDNLMEGRIEMSGEDTVYRSNNIYVFCIIEEEKEISDILKIVLETVDVSTDKSILELADIDNDYTYIESSDHTSDKTTFAWTLLSTAINELAEYAGFEWYIDINKKLHFYENRIVPVTTTITEDDLVGNPRLGAYKETVNRAIVFGGHWNKIDQTGHTKDSTYVATDTVSRESYFVPTMNLLSSVQVWTSLVVNSESNLVLTIEDAASNIISNSLITAYQDDITDGGYTEFKYNSFVELVVGETYYVHLEGTTSDGVNIGKGIVNSVTKIDYVTKHPVRVGSISIDKASYEKYGMLMDVDVDTNIDDQVLAKLKSDSMLNGEPQKLATIHVADDSIETGNLLRVYFTKPGIQIDDVMKVVKSTLTPKHIYIKNTLECEEL